MWVVVAVSLDVVEGTRVGDQTAELTDCNTMHHFHSKCHASGRNVISPAVLCCGRGNDLRKNIGFAPSPYVHETLFD